MIPRPPQSKVLLVADPRSTPASGPSTPLRRFRLARLHLDSRPATGAARFDHIKRVYD